MYSARIRYREGCKCKEFRDIYSSHGIFVPRAIGTLEKGVKHVQIQQIHENKGVSDVVINCTFIVYFEHDSRLFLVFQLLTLNRYLFQMFAGLVHNL